MNTTQMPSKITLEQLATMVQRGFEHTASKEGLEGLRAEMYQRFEAVDRRFDSIDIEIREIKAVLKPLVKRVEVLETDVWDLRSKVKRAKK